MRVFPCLWLISPSWLRWRLSRPALLMPFSMVPASDSILPQGPNGNLAPQHIEAGLIERSCTPWPASGALQALSAYTDAACILARSRANVIRHVMQTVGAASTPPSACVSRRQRSLVPLPWDRRALDYFENEKRFPGAQDRSNDQPLPATSNCARGLKWRVVCITFRYCGSPVLSC